jgi:branched-chain amino acid transport system substrate-binding protein
MTAFGQQVKARLAVGVVLPLSGSMSAFGSDVMRGIEFAMAELKEKDADLAGRIDIHVEDSQSQTKQSEAMARKLFATRRADVLIGGLTSSTGYSLARIAREVQKPMILAAATHPGLTAVGPGIFRTCAPDDQQGAALAKYAFQSLQKTQAAIAFEKNSAYGRSIAQAFEKAFTALGGKIVLKREFEPGAAMREIVRAARKVETEVLLAPLHYTEAAQLIDATKEEGARFKLLGTDSWDSPKLWRLVNKSAAKGHFFTTQFSIQDKSPDTLAFVGAFQSKYRVAPTQLASQGYDAMQVVFDSFRRARSNLASALMKSLPTTANLAASSGAITIDSQRNARKPWKIMATGPSDATFVTRITVDD